MNYDDIRKLPAVEQRVETGPIQFGDDWPGTFIRGDNAAHYAWALEAYLDGQGDVFTKMVVQNLLSVLRSSNLMLRASGTSSEVP